MYLYGAGGHAKVITDILKANKIEVKAFIDDNKELTTLLGYPVLHNKTGDISPLIICIGNNEIRKKIVSTLVADYAVVIHPSVIVSDSVNIGVGTVIIERAVIQIDSQVGEHTIINTGASICHDCIVGNFTHIGPGSILCGNVSVGEGTWIGAGATIIQGINIGKWAMVGAGAVVVKDVPDYAVVVGVPAQIIKYKNLENE